MPKITIIDGVDEIELSTAPEENIKAYMVKGEPGTDGVSPTISASRSGKTTTITITDKNGVASTDINDGIDPTVTTSKADRTTTVTITDVNGTRQTEIYDGIDLTGGVPTDGVIGWDNDDIVYTCDGTESGNYYLTYNNVNYYFTMPTVEENDKLFFNTTSLILSLNGTAITTGSSGSGTELTFVEYIPNGYELSDETFGGNDGGIIALKTITTAPSTFNTGDRYYNSTNDLIYTATSSSTWNNGETPSITSLYLNEADNKLYRYYNNTMNVLESGNSGGGSLKIGTIIPYAGDTLPTGYLYCDGSAISRTTYADLFSVIGTTYGNGNGTTTFNLPNLKGRVPVGYDSTQFEFDNLGETGGEKTHQLVITEIPSHDHKIFIDSAGTGGKWGPTGTVQQSTNTYTATDVTGGGEAHNNLQPFLVVNYIIKATQTTPVQAEVINEQSSSTTDTYSSNFVNGLLSNLVNFSKGTLTNNTNVLQYNTSYYIELGNLVFLIISDVQFKTAVTDTTTIMSGAPAPASDVAFLMTKVNGTVARLHVGTDGNVKDWYSNIEADTSGFGYWYGFVAYIKA